jgi:hypothetical protein
MPAAVCTAQTWWSISVVPPEKGFLLCPAVNTIDAFQFESPKQVGVKESQSGKRPRSAAGFTPGKKPTLMHSEGRNDT